MNDGVDYGVDPDRDTRFEGFSDFKFVSRRMAEAIDDATDATELVGSLYAEGAQLNPREVAIARSKILAAAMRLRPEMIANKNSNERYEAILDDWEGDDGYIKRFRDTSLYDEFPEWLPEFSNQIRVAGFMLGYLKAGREVDTEEEQFSGSEVDNLL